MKRTSRQVAACPEMATLAVSRQEEFAVRAERKITNVVLLLER